MLPVITIGSAHLAGYGLMMALGFITAAVCGGFIYKRNGGYFWDFIALGVVSFLFALLGAAVTYILVTYSLKEIWNWIVTGEYDTYKGIGLVFYGGLIGGIPGFLIGKRMIRARFDQVARAFATVIPLGHALGRVGCFLGGCCYGIPWTGAFAVTYPEITGIPGPRFPVQLLEAALLLILFAALLFCMLKGMTGLRLTAMYAGCYSVIRFITEFFRGDEIRGHAGAFSTSQWISLAVFLAALVMFVLCRAGMDVPKDAGKDDATRAVR